MADEKVSKSETIAKAVEKLADSKGLAEIGKGLGNGIVALAAALALIGFSAGMIAAGKWDGHLHSEEKCFQLQEISGKTYKVNTCTGDVALLDSKAGETATSARP